jgi:hypothetical protein
MNNFVNEIVWAYEDIGSRAVNYFKRKHDTLLVYQKTENKKFNIIRKKLSESTIKRYQKYFDENGQITYKKLKETNPGVFNKLKGTPENLEEVWLDINNGQPLNDWWTDISPLKNGFNEYTNYPTQKPEGLLERIIRAYTNVGDLVFDCFMGSGTTQAVAMKLGRRFIGADINLGSIQTTTKRLINIANSGSKDDDNYYGFEVYNVNKNSSVKSEVEVCVVVENNKLKINDFFSMKLSQKMNIEKGKEEWRRFVEFIVIDLDYDGSVIRPSIIDIPSENELVKGEYDIPSDASKIKIKITDISLETFEFEITNIFF